MNLTVVIPVGPGHEEIVRKAVASVEAAWHRGHYKFTDLSITPILDTKGLLGRCRARNIGILQATDADWIFLLDADDAMMPDALTLPMPAGKDALFGPANVIYWPKYGREVKPWKHLTAEPPLNWKDLISQGPVQSYMMGNFYRAEALRNHLFREDLDHGEDWEHHLSFLAKHDWAVAGTPLVLADTTAPSAGGPRGGAVNWRNASEPFFEFWRKRGRIPLTDEERATEYWKPCV